jgi:hypothetical protein
VWTLPDDTLYRVTVALLVEAGLCLRRTDRLDDLDRWIHEVGDRHIFTGVMYLGTAQRLQGGLARLRGDQAEAEACFRAAIEASTEIGATPALVATRLDWADMLDASGDREGAQALAEAALADIGSLPLQRQRRRAEAMTQGSRAKF